jgi:hypothetical protein
MQYRKPEHEASHLLPNLFFDTLKLFFAATKRFASPIAAAHIGVASTGTEPCRSSVATRLARHKLESTRTDTHQVVGGPFHGSDWLVHEQKKFSEFCGNACGAAQRSALEHPRLLTAPLLRASELNPGRGIGRHQLMSKSFDNPSFDLASTNACTIGAGSLPSGSGAGDVILTDRRGRPAANAANRFPGQEMLGPTAGPELRRASLGYRVAIPLV